MTRQEHLLVRAMEECNEVAQRLSKALVFGLDEIQPGQTLTNRERVMYEYYDLRAVLGMAGFDAWDTSDRARQHEADKTSKVRKYLAYSRERGLVSDDLLPPEAR